MYHDRPPRIGPMQLWRLSTRLYRAGHYRSAKVLKGVSFVLFRAILPPEVELGRDVRLEHYGFGVVIHPNTTLGDRCRIYHGVTLGSSASIGSADRIVVGTDVLVGAGAVVVNRIGSTLHIGDRARLGANCVVVGDVPPDASVLAPLGTVVSRTGGAR